MVQGPTKFAVGNIVQNFKKLKFVALTSIDVGTREDELVKLKNLIIETPIKAGNFDEAASRFGSMKKDVWLRSAVTAKLDDFDIRLTDGFYSAWDRDVLVFFMKIKSFKDGLEVDDVWTSASYRGKRIFSKMLAFLKTRERTNVIYLGNVHSVDTYNLIASGAFTSFKKYWLNKFGQRAEFNPADVDEYYGSGNWTLVLENFNEYGSFPRFNDDGYIRESYDILLQILE